MPKKAREKQKNLCGDYGGVNRFGQPCERPAGWRTDHKGTGPCMFHPDVRKPQAPRNIPEQYSFKAHRLKTVNDGKIGKPGYYDETFPALVYRFCLMGARDVDLARLLEIDVSVLYDWRKAHPELESAIKEGREIADAEVANAIYHAAVGYEHEDTKFFAYEGDIISETYTKHYPPNVQAGQFWLYNRQPQRWKDQRRIELSGTLHMEVSQLSDEELLKRLEERRARIGALRPTLLLPAST